MPVELLARHAGLDRAVEILRIDLEDRGSCREVSSEMPPPGALTWPSSEVPTPKAMTGTRCSAQARTTSCTSSVAFGKDDAVRRLRRDVGGGVRVLVADRLRRSGSARRSAASGCRARQRCRPRCARPVSRSLRAMFPPRMDQRRRFCLCLLCGSRIDRQSARTSALVQPRQRQGSFRCPSPPPSSPASWTSRRTGSTTTAISTWPITTCCSTAARTTPSRLMGMGPDYARERKLTIYTAEVHVCYVQELHLDAQGHGHLPAHRP